MSKYLISTVETYRIDTESEVKEFIEEAKHNPSFQLKKYVSEYKEKSKGGEIIDEYFKVSLTKGFNDIQEPISTAMPYYATKEAASENA